MKTHAQEVEDLYVQIGMVCDDHKPMDAIDACVTVIAVYVLSLTTNGFTDELVRLVCNHLRARVAEINRHA